MKYIWFLVNVKIKPLKSWDGVNFASSPQENTLLLLFWEEITSWQPPFISKVTDQTPLKETFEQLHDLHY